jgi:hypothetical protein
MSEIKVSNISNRAGTSGAVIVGVTSSIGTGSARLASGDNSERVGIEEGSIRYNETAKLIEFYDGTQWNFIIPAEESANALGVFGGGYTAPNYVELGTIDYITISTLGDAKSFGTLSQTRTYLGSCSSSTRGVFGGGFTNTIDYITIATTGNATDFGDLTQTRGTSSACSSSTRGVFGGGSTPTIVNTIDYITIATTGNATDFGDLTQARLNLTAGSSSTRGVFGGGRDNSSPAFIYYNTIDFITIATTGNATDFGDLRELQDAMGSCSSSTRGVFGGGGSPTYTSFLVKIDYITIATTGNATDFGDLTQSKYFPSACSSSIRGVFGGGILAPYISTNTIEYITIATTGNAQLFGNLTKDQGLPNNSALSNNHGGLL